MDIRLDFIDPSHSHLIYFHSQFHAAVDSFHIDRSGQIFINGMNEAMKLMQQSNYWTDIKCSEQTRYGILSAVYLPLDLKCHFTFGTGVGVRNTDIIKSLFAAQPVGM